MGSGEGLGNSSAAADAAAVALAVAVQGVGPGPGPDLGPIWIHWAQLEFIFGTQKPREAASTPTTGF